MMRNGFFECDSCGGPISRRRGELVMTDVPKSPFNGLMGSGHYHRRCRELLDRRDACAGHSAAGEPGHA